ncbi:carboxymuconolactone decarboxylase family protein [Spirosoma soli]|uniref:Carboxymuconolactone decarboxylase family protein n=1 Tax=Spirosoma soli TaxID=1770529 RepID=A0ABW5M1L1_9BACT
MQTNNQYRMQTGQQLSVKQQSIVTISAFTAQGNIAQLQQALNQGLDAGLSINEIKEIRAALCLYRIPRSLNALQRFVDVLKERKQQGINEPVGKEPSPLPTDKSIGRDNLDWKTREIVTISALAALGGVESQLCAHFGIGMHNGLTKRACGHFSSL